MPEITLEEYLSADQALFNQWATDSNATEDTGELLTLAEKFIQDKKNQLTNAGGHPQNPRPRVRT